jgi:hypothetical protein
MALVAAPGRTLKTYSTILAIAIAALDAAVLIAQQLTDLHIMTAEHLAALNGVLAALIVPLKLIKQEIPATTEEKQDLVAQAAQIPVKPGHEDVVVAVGTGSPDTIVSPPRAGP